MSFGFILSSYINSHVSYRSLIDSISLIRRIHPKRKIVIIDDHSQWNFNNFPSDENIIRVPSKHKGGGEMNPYYYFYHNKPFDRAVIIHDSFHLLAPIENIDEIDVKFIWHFNVHRTRWHNTMEPESEYNKKNNIKNHDDKIIDFVAKSEMTEDFKSWFNTIYMDKDRWTGCFGIMSIISHDFLTLLQEKTNILSTLEKIRDRRDRMVMESVFALACKFVREDNYENSYDGLVVDETFHNGLRTKRFWKKSFCR